MLKLNCLHSSFNSLPGLVTRQTSSSTAATHKIHTKELTICSKLYQSWRSVGVPGYRTAPAQGLKVKAKYLDARSPSWSPDSGLTVLALHGAPGSFQNYDPITSRLTSQPDRPIRMIVPNFPNFSLYEKSNRVFKHTTEERTCFLRTLLQAIGIHEVDLLIGHSGGIYATMRLLDRDDIFDVSEPMNTRSIAIFNPAPTDWKGSHLSRLAMKTLVLGYRYPISTKIMRRLNPLWLPKFGLKCDPDNPDEPIFSAFVMTNSQLERFGPQLDRHVKSRDLPRLLVYSGRDRLFTREEFERIETMMGINQSQRATYQKGSRIGEVTLSDSEKGTFSESVYFQDGGHWAYVREPDIVVHHLKRLIKTI